MVSAPGGVRPGRRARQTLRRVKAGGKVVASMPGGRTEKHKVQRLIVTKAGHDFVDLTVSTAYRGRGPPSCLTTTTNHPFYDITQAAFTNAADLHPGDELQQPDGGTATVRTVHRYNTSQVTYDLTINGLHTYYVLAGNTPVLVHNDNLPCSHPIHALGESGRASYRQLGSALNEVTGRSAVDLGDLVTPAQRAAVLEKPFLKRVFYGSVVESAVAGHPGVVADGNITHMGNAMPGQAVPDFEIRANGRTFSVDITGPSEGSWRDHWSRPYITSPFQIMTYGHPSDDYLDDMFR
ncbi:polymorphic toxin-type HINT domain-containing protein [Actinomadura parmotrematis]|uniref:HINT domain-containing protein n=1 Tax=Actinomadura parmotrematis TaxID=2864039 RepID=A0ABS7FQ47_9ACTN|nr:polymorphic toxin-type HINT domain-containing protein [Actinomadura parmotrematis]MBW8482525.1 HINT domain-containing protein [Actinomadura parmotrematis]